MSFILVASNRQSIHLPSCCVSMMQMLTLSPLTNASIMFTVMKVIEMELKMPLFYYATQKMHFFFQKHCEYLLVPMLPLPYNKFWIIMWSVGRSNYFSAKARINLHLIHIRFVPQKEYKDTGCSCHLPIFFAV